MYEGILNLNRSVNKYTLDHTLAEQVDCALVKSHTTENPSHKQIIYCVKKQAVSKQREPVLFGFVKEVMENKNGLYPALIELMQTPQNYYLVFQEANLLVDAASSQMYRHPSAVPTRNKLLVYLLNICERIPIALSMQEFVVSGERVFILPHFFKLPGNHKPENRQLFMNLAYLMCFGVTGQEDQTHGRYAKWRDLHRQYYERNDFLAILLKFVEENQGSSAVGSSRGNPNAPSLHYPNLDKTVDSVPQIHVKSPTEQPQPKPQLVNKTVGEQPDPKFGVSSKSQLEPAEEEFDSELNNIGVNPKMKQLASQIRDSRKSHIRPNQNEGLPDLASLGIGLEPNTTQPRHQEPQVSPVNNAHQQTTNNMPGILKKDEKPALIKPEPGHLSRATQQKPTNPPQQPNPKDTNTLGNLFSRQKTVRYDEFNKPQQQPIANSQPIATDNPFHTPERNPNLTTVYLKKDQGKDETNQIFNTINQSFMGPLSSSSSGGFKSFASKTMQLTNKEIKLSGSSDKDQFDMLFKAYMSQFDMLHAMLKSFMTYYQGTNMGLVASYLIARCAVHRKLRLMDALIQQQDLFDCGEKIYKKINKHKYYKYIEDWLYKDDPAKIKAAINFNMVLPQTLEIMEPYLGDIDSTDRTEEMTFYYLYCLSKRSHNKDMHTMLLHDCMFVLLHTNNEFVYDYSEMPKQWDEAYVNERKKTIELLMFKPT